MPRRPGLLRAKGAKPASTTLWGWISTHSMGDASEWNIDEDVCNRIVERHMVQWRQHLYQGGQVTWAGQQRGFIDTECVLARRVCSLNLSLFENVCCIKNRRIRQGGSWTVEQLGILYLASKDKNNLAKKQQLVSSVPQGLKAVIKRKGDVTHDVRHASLWYQHSHFRFVHICLFCTLKITSFVFDR